MMWGIRSHSTVSPMFVGTVAMFFSNHQVGKRSARPISSRGSAEYFLYSEELSR